MKTKIIYILLALLLVLTSCNVGGPNVESTPVETPIETPTETPEATPEETPEETPEASETPEETPYHPLEDICEQIKEGQTFAEVCSVLGDNYILISSIRNEYEWNVEHGKIFVGFNALNSDAVIPDDLIVNHRGAGFLYSGIFVSPIPPTYTGEAEYERLISTTELPKDFVYYDSIKQLGEFVYILFASTYPDYYIPDIMEYELYWYKLVDENNIEISLTINTAYQEPNYYYDVYDVYMDDMRLANDFSTKRSVRIINDGIIYEYNKQGVLSKVGWLNGDMYVSVGVSGYADVTLDGEDTHATRLLNANTAKSVAEEINEYINNYNKPNKPPSETN